MSWVNSRLIIINCTFLFVLNVPSINHFQVFYNLINMRMEIYGALCKCMFIIIETIVNIEHEDYTFFKANRCFLKNCSCLVDTWKKKYKVPTTSLSLHWAIYLHKPVYIFVGQGSWLLLNVQIVNSLYCLLLHLFASLCPHTVFWCS